MLLGTVNVPDTVACLVRSVADQASVPQWLLMGIVSAESGFDPRALGDGRTSYGLLQLHVGGQADDYTAGPLTDLFDPYTNLHTGIPYIATAYLDAVTIGLVDQALIAHVATHSGHPGRVTGSDPRVLAIFAATVALITDGHGNLAPWPPHDPSRCPLPGQQGQPHDLWHEADIPVSPRQVSAALVAHGVRIAQLASGHVDA